jgi:hypothetical protein
VTTEDNEHTPSLTAKGRRLLDVFERFGGPPLHRRTSTGMGRTSDV